MRCATASTSGRPFENDGRAYSTSSLDTGTDGDEKTYSITSGGSASWSRALSQGVSAPITGRGVMATSLVADTSSTECVPSMRNSVARFPK